MRRYAILLAALLIASCTRTDLESPAAKGTSAIASIEEEARAYLAENPYSIRWAADDEISVVTGSEEKRFVLTDGADSGLGTFWCDGDVASGVHFALYPRCAGSRAEGDRINLEYPSVLQYDALRRCAGSGTMAARSNGLNFKFKNACAYIRFSVSGSGSLSSMDIIAKEDVPLSGTALLEYPEEGEPAVTMTGAKAGVTVLFEPALELGDEPRTFYVSLPPVNLSKGVKVTFECSDGSSVCRSVSCATLERSSLLVMENLSYTRDGYLDLTLLNSRSAGLTRAEAANCYIVTGPGGYKFPADFLPDGSPLSGIPASAIVVWENNGYVTPPGEGSIVRNPVYSPDGYIRFDTPRTFKEGNALIAVTDSSGEILWSWHIWVTADAISTGTIAGFTTMDRNIGALSANPKEGAQTFGMFYQWGRKDPFPGSCNPTDSIFAAVSGRPLTTTTRSSVTGTMAYAAAHPNEYINTSSNDWLVVSNDNLWSETKSVNDPCPPGWQVPPRSWGQGVTTAGSKWSGNATDGYGRTHTASGLWFPAAGKISYRNLSDYGDNLNSVGIQGRYYTCEGVKGGTSAYAMGFASSSVSNSSHKKSCAYSVRCVRR
ncbi:MAG: hypothetical protein J5699_02150 [Bacteroidales bacterium]|nr:hypothetical protein [Bacteroidales bacterium]